MPRARVSTCEHTAVAGDDDELRVWHPSRVGEASEREGRPRIGGDDRCHRLDETPRCPPHDSGTVKSRGVDDGERVGESGGNVDGAGDQPLRARALEPFGEELRHRLGEGGEELHRPRAGGRWRWRKRMSACGGRRRVRRRRRIENGSGSR